MNKPSTSVVGVIDVDDDPWIFSAEQLANTPSYTMHGVDTKTEERYRLQGGELIYKIGLSLNLDPWPTLGTACAYYQRFYMVHSFRTYNRNVTALACLYLAAKVEEAPKKIAHIVESARRILDADQWQRMGAAPADEIINVEHILLQTLRFDLTVTHAYQFVCEYAKIFIEDEEKPYVKGLVQAAFALVNDCNKTTLILQYEPEMLAVATLYLVIKMQKASVKWPNMERKPWWSEFMIGIEEDGNLKEVCDAILDLYTEHASPSEASPSTSSPSASPREPPSTTGRARSKPPTPAQHRRHSTHNGAGTQRLMPPPPPPPMNKQPPQRQPMLIEQQQQQAIQQMHWRPHPPHAGLSSWTPQPPQPTTQQHNYPTPYSVPQPGYSNQQQVQATPPKQPRLSQYNSISPAQAPMHYGHYTQEQPRQY